MTKEEFATALAEINRKRNELNAEEKTLYKVYLNDQRKYNVDDKVSVTINNRFSEKTEVIVAYIRGFHCHEDGSTYYTFTKSKKDGSKGSHRVYIYSGDTVSIELIEPAKATTND